MENDTGGKLMPSEQPRVNNSLNTATEEILLLPVDVAALQQAADFLIAKE